MCAVQSKLTPVYATCMEYVHPWTEHCTIATAEVLLLAAQESFRIYSAVYAVRDLNIQASFQIHCDNHFISFFLPFFIILHS